MEKRMIFFTVILVILALANFTSGKAILAVNSTLEQESELNPGGFVAETPTATENITDEPRHMRSENNQMKSPTTEPSDLKQTKTAENSKQENKDLRAKRSYYPYTTDYQMPWPQLEGSNQWTANVYSIQSPYFVSINEYDNSNPNINSKYSYFNSAGRHSNKTERKKAAPLGSSNKRRPNRRTTIKPIIGQSGNTEEESKPVWDVTAYRPGNSKSTRHSRASKRELTPHVGRSPFFIMEDNRESRKLIHLTNDYMERNEIPFFSFTTQRSPSPTKCAWAILSCCSSSSEEINHKCFREMGCEEKFWNKRLCSDEFKRTAVETASSFYNGGSEKSDAE